MRRIAAILFVLLPASPAFAGLYSVDDPCPFTVKPDGTADPLPNDRFVRDFLNPRVYAGFPTTPEVPVSLDWVVEGDDGEPVAKATYGGRLNQLVCARWPKAGQLRGADLASHAAALILLKPRSEKLPLDGERLEALLLAARRNPLAQANLAHLYAATGRWEDASVFAPDPDDTAAPDRKSVV